MSAINTMAPPAKAHPLQNYVATQIRNGVDHDMIVSELGKSGVEESMAHRLVESTQHQAMNGAIQPTGAVPSLQSSILGGLVASLITGAIWGGIVLATGYELGIVAWGVGAAVGYGVLMFSKGECGFPQQVTAVGFSILGILMGKYFAFYVILKEAVGVEFGPETAGEMSVFSPGLFLTYLANLGEVMGPYDLLWIVLACISAYKLTSDSADA